MPFCPKCRFEYREGIEKCPDCDLKLVEKLHEGEQEQCRSEELVEIATFPYAAGAEMARVKLAGEGIEAVVTDSASSTLVPLVCGVRLMVHERDAARAMKILGEE